MSNNIPTVPGVDRDALANEIYRNTIVSTQASHRAADIALSHIADNHECALPATWDDDGARPVEGEHGWVTPLLPDGTQRFPDGTPVEVWRHGYADYARTLDYIAGDKYAPMFGGIVIPWHRSALIRPVLPPTACEQDDEWVEVDKSSRDDLRQGVRLRREWLSGDFGETNRLFVHRDDFQASDPDADRVEGMAKAIFKHDYPDYEWDGNFAKGFHEEYRQVASVALAASREEQA